MNKSKKEKTISEKLDLTNKNSQGQDLQKSNDEPSWYHYFIVLFFIFIFFVGINYFLNGYSDSSVAVTGVNLTNSSSKLQEYSYSYEEAGKIYNFKFNSPVSVLKSYNVTNQLYKYDLLNSKSITFIFGEYKGLDNKYVSISSVKFMRFLKSYFNVGFTSDNFKMNSNYSCLNSTLNNKMVFFNPYSNSTGVYYNNMSGCILINAKTPLGLVEVTDKLMYMLVNS